MLEHEKCVHVFFDKFVFFESNSRTVTDTQLDSQKNSYLVFCHFVALFLKLMTLVLDFISETKSENL